MKKIIIFILLLLLFINTKAYIKDIDLKLTNEESALIFLSFNNVKGLIYMNQNSSFLLVDNNKKNIKINKILQAFDIKPKVFIKKEIENGKIKNFYKKKIILNNYKICEYTPYVNCDFVYISELKDNIKLNNNTKAIFYENSIKKDYLLKESWVNKYELNSDSIVILKTTSKKYDIFVIPLAKE